MSSDIFSDYSDVNYLSELKKKYFHGENKNLRSTQSSISNAAISLIILTMCVGGRIVASSANLIDNSSWQHQRPLNFRNISEQIPSFGKVPSSIEVMPGQTVVLSCIVENLGDRTVSWIRTSDLQILTSGSITFTGDNRFSTEPTDDALSNCWGLMIRNVRYTDTGQYECQLNTSPKLKINVTLIVRETLLMDRPFDGTTIEGPREQEIKRGGTIALACRATISMSNNEQNKISINRNDGAPRTKRVFWSMNNTPMTLQIKRGGINVYTDWNFNEVVSNLTVTSVTETDQGVYKCSIDDIGSDEVFVHVVDDYKTSGLAAASASNLISSLFIYAIVVVIFNLF